MSNAAHWENVYQTKQADAVSWFRPHLETSLLLLDRCDVPRTASIVDAGGGASTLVDDLVARGFTNVTVADLSPTALATARARLQGRVGARFVEGDVTTPLFAEQSVDVWHDRAVFHFLTDDVARAAWATQVHRVVRAGGHVIVGAFADDGPERCSGLPVARYAPAALARVLGDGFDVLDERRDEHTTPWGAVQRFAWVRWRRRAT
jgi:SAM-dependent methyltransferase